MKTRAYDPKPKHHDLVKNVDFYEWCRRQSNNVDYDKIIEAYEKVEWPKNRPMDFAKEKGIHVNTYYSRLDKYMELAKQYKAERNEH
jgi:hypothetical protein